MKDYEEIATALANHLADKDGCPPEPWSPEGGCGQYRDPRGVCVRDRADCWIEWAESKGGE